MAKPAVILVGADKGGVGKTTVSRALLDYFIGVRTERVETKPNANCSLFLDQGSRSDDSPEGPDGNWRIIWEGNRPGDNSERFRLYQRSNG